MISFQARQKAPKACPACGMGKSKNVPLGAQFLIISILPTLPLLPSFNPASAFGIFLLQHDAIALAPCAKMKKLLTIHIA